MKLTAKHIIFALMMVLLVLVIVMGCLVFGRVGGLLQMVMNTGNTTEPTIATEPSDPIPSSSVAPPSSQPEETTAPHEHNYYVDKKVSATCDTGGYTLYGCSCGKGDIRDFTDPLGHKYGDYTVVPATCDTDGWTERTCSRCKKTEITEPTTAGHSFGSWTASGNTKQRICSACNITEIQSQDATQTWMMYVSAKVQQGNYDYYKITVDLAQTDADPVYELYFNTALGAVGFDYADGLLLNYAVNGVDTSYTAPAGTTVLTIDADGVVTFTAPVEEPAPNPNPDPGADPEGGDGTDPEGGDGTNPEGGENPEGGDPT